KKAQTVGYHRALSAEGILSLHPTAIIHDNNIGPPQVVDQIKQLNIPLKTFTAKNDSFDGTKALIREMGAYFHKEARAEELCKTLDEQKAASLEKVKQYTDRPKVAVIHFGRASNVYMVVGKGGGGDSGGVSQMIEAHALARISRKSQLSFTKSDDATWHPASNSFRVGFRHAARFGRLNSLWRDRFFTHGHCAGANFRPSRTSRTNSGPAHLS